MLAELSIRDLVLIPRITLRFGSGLNVLSGETGAGKSLIVGSLRLLCGEKAAAGLVRPGAERAIVEGVFELEPGGWIARGLADLGLECDDGELILRREIPANGRGRVRANGLAIPLDTLRSASELLIDLHGQHDHQSLLRASFQGTALDEFAGLLEERDSFAERLSEWKAAHAELERELRASREEHERRELARFQWQELRAAAPLPGERTRLLVEHGRLERAEFLRTSAARCADELLERDDSVHDTMSELAELAESAAESDPAWKGLAEALASLAIGAAEAARDAVALGELAVDDPDRLAEVRDRLRVWDDLLRKYGPEESDVIEFRDRLAAEAADPEARERHLEALRGRVEGISDRLSKLGVSLRRKRRRAALGLARAVEEALAGVGMAGARFEVLVTPREQGVAFRGEVSPERAGSSGLDAVEFRLAANRGQEPRALRDVASGGEISRVMLCLKSVLGNVRGTATMAFDEIDAGVGGTVAANVAETLAAIGTSRQVLCITHLAAIASRADHQLRVLKEDVDGVAVTAVEPVEGEARIREVARMLGGGESEGVVLEHARELLKERT